MGSHTSMKDGTPDLWSHDGVSETEISAHLDAVLGSKAFLSSRRCSAFLRYAVDRALARDASQLKEGAIALAVFERTSVVEGVGDSVVRVCAREVRKHLERYYSEDGAADSIRIQLPVGSYVPRFHKVPEESFPAPESSPVQLEIPALEANRAWRKAATWIGAVLIVSVAFAVGRYQFPAPGGGVDPILREAWGPLGRPGADVLIVIGSTLHMSVRPKWQETPDGPPRYQLVPELYPYFRKERRLKPDVELFMHPTENSLDFGELKAVVTATNHLRASGATYQVLPERGTSFVAVRDRSAIVLGNNQTSNIAQEELSRGLWTIDFEPPLGRVAIVDQKQAGRPAPFLAQYGKPSEPTWCCGLITVLPAEGAPNNARTIVISGVTPTGSEAAMEFFTSAAALRDLRLRFQREGYRGFPSGYQVVVKCRSRDTFLLTSEYAAHHVLLR